MPVRAQRTIARLVMRSAVAAAVIPVVLLATATSAAAHADLVSSSPATGVVLAAEPGQVTLGYSEAVTPQLSTIRVIGPDGRSLAEGAPHYGGSDRDSLVVPLAPDASQGTYVVEWQATAADDGHATSGFVTFSVGARSRLFAPVQATTRDGLTDALVGIALWLGFAGLALMVGDTAVRAMTRTHGPGGPGEARSLPGTWIAPLGWAVTLLATLLQLLLSGPYARGEAPTHAFDRSLLSAALPTPEGRALTARLVLLAVAAVLGAAPTSRAGSPWYSAVLTLALAATWSATSHAASGSGVPLALAMTTVHVAAMAVWVGGLSSLVVLLRHGGDRLADPAGVCRRFSRLAQLAVAALAASGLYQAWREVGAFPALTGTGYGRILIGKILVLAGVLCAAAGSRALLRRRAEGLARLRAVVALELGGTAVLLVLTVLLLAGDPARHAGASLGSGHR